MESLALWCGIFGILSSIVAVVVVFLTRKNIIDIIDKEVILFEGNFNTKKDAITASFDILDEIMTKGKQATYNTEFLTRARKAYNNLYCVLTNSDIAKEFYDMTMLPMSNVYQARVDEYKNMCRRDIGFKVKKQKQTTQNNYSYSQPVQQYIQPTQPVQPAQPVQPQVVNTPQTAPAADPKRAGRPKKEI